MRKPYAAGPRSRSASSKASACASSRRRAPGAEADLYADGCAYLQVHTVGASFEHAGYAESRAFYRRCEFAPLHEIHGIDWDGPTPISVKWLGRSLRQVHPTTLQSAERDARAAGRHVDLLV